MACPHAPLLIFPRILTANEICKEYPFSHPSSTVDDLKRMHDGLPRVLSVFSTLITQHTRTQHPQDIRKSKYYHSVQGDFKIFMEMDDWRKKGDTNMRILIPNLDRMMAQEQFFIIGFFGFKLPESPVTKQIWEFDDMLVAAIPSFSGIFAYHPSLPFRGVSFRQKRQIEKKRYVTIRKEDGQYFNYVWLENFEMVDKWRSFHAHLGAVSISPKYPVYSFFFLQVSFPYHYFSLDIINITRM